MYIVKILWTASKKAIRRKLDWDRSDGRKVEEVDFIEEPKYD